jgi:hypothetical protein
LLVAQSRDVRGELREDRMQLRKSLVPNNIPPAW